MSLFQDWVLVSCCCFFPTKAIQANQSSSQVFSSLRVTGSTEFCSSTGQLFKAKQLLFVSWNEVFERVLG